MIDLNFLGLSVWILGVIIMVIGWGSDKEPVTKGGFVLQGVGIGLQFAGLLIR